MSSADPNGARRSFTPETLDAFFRSTVDSKHQLSRSPACYLVIEPHERRLKLQTPASDTPAEVAPYDRLTFDVIEVPGEEGTWFELSVAADGMAFEAYSLLVTVVDQLERGVPFKLAVGEALATYRDLLSKKRSLSDEQETGLFGELLVLEHLIGRSGEDAAVTAWLGPESEEHDFVAPVADLEVKTTRAEARVHVIGSLSQLAASPDRPLYLVSIQLTGGGAAERARTLPEVVFGLRSGMNRARRAFDERLRELNWRDEDATDLYRRRWMLRSSPRAYEVGPEFPAITARGLKLAMAHPELVVGVSYRVDVSNIERSAPPALLTGFCEGVDR